jgi:hypothetical protein
VKLFLRERHKGFGFRHVLLTWNWDMGGIKGLRYQAQGTGVNNREHIEILKQVQDGP